MPLKTTITIETKPTSLCASKLNVVSITVMQNEKNTVISIIKYNEPTHWLHLPIIIMQEALISQLEYLCEWEASFILHKALLQYILHKHKTICQSIYSLDFIMSLFQIIIACSWSCCESTLATVFEKDLEGQNEGGNKTNTTCTSTIFITDKNEINSIPKDRVVPHNGMVLQYDT